MPYMGIDRLNWIERWFQTDWMHREILAEVVVRFKSGVGEQRCGAHYHACVWSERDDSFYASCRREWWSAELHIDFGAVRGAVVLTPSPKPTCGLLFFFFFFLSYRLSHKSGISFSCFPLECCLTLSCGARKDATDAERRRPPLSSVPICSCHVTSACGGHLAMSRRHKQLFWLHCTHVEDFRATK